MILIGLGAVALMAMGGKKKPAPKDDEPGEDSGLDRGPLIAQKATIGAKKSVMAKRPPLNYRNIALSQASVSQAKACHLQGMTDLSEITMCIAKKMFPGWNWTNRVPWQNNAWTQMLNVARAEMDLPPLIS